MHKNTIFIFIILLISVYGCTTDQNGKFTSLFNGKDLTNRETYIGIPEPSVSVKGIPKDSLGKYIRPIGLNNDPLHIFTVVTEDGQPAVRASGQVYGALATNKEYENYHFRMQVKWGNLKWPPREDKPRNSGLLYHGTGAYGNGLGVWKNSHECQVMETMFGDSYRMGDTYCNIEATRPAGPDRYVFTPGAPSVVFGAGKPGGKIARKAWSMKSRSTNGIVLKSFALKAQPYTSLTEKLT